MNAEVTVLIAEDEFALRTFAGEALEEAGFRVHEAAATNGALTILESHAGQTDLLFTDINMPGAVDGLELARRPPPLASHCSFDFIWTSPANRGRFAARLAFPI